MSNASHPRHPPFALLTDLYQLTMAYGYWRHGLAEREAAFHLTFRTCPFNGQYAIHCGLHDVVEYLEQLRFTPDDVAYLATLTGADGRPLFPEEFLQVLAGLEFRCDVDAIPEGTAVFAHEPLVLVRGPLLQCQLIETALLNQINFQTLVATKATRVCRAARGQPVLEFGLRRAQGVDGGLAASRAAYIGGCAATSNVLAGKLFGIPVRGTHAHSWVMAFDDEPQAFAAYAQALPNNCIFLVDTYDTLAGVRHAAAVGQQLRRQGQRLLGIRLDSGALGPLSQAAREILDQAGLTDARIVASNDLDEYAIDALQRAGAVIDIWGVGTRLVTAYDQPALGGVYKLSALRDDRGAWAYKLKLSEQDIKISHPGLLQVRRGRDATGRFVADVIYDLLLGIPQAPRVIPLGGDESALAFSVSEAEDLLVPIFRQGRRVYTAPPTESVRQRTHEQLQALDPAVLRLESPGPYAVGLEDRLHALKNRLIVMARES